MTYLKKGLTARKGGCDAHTSHDTSHFGPALDWSGAKGGKAGRKIGQVPALYHRPNPRVVATLTCTAHGASPRRGEA